MPQARLYIGRFQPFHNGHLMLFNDMVSRCERPVIGLGSAGGPPTERNPFSLYERREMITTNLPFDSNVRFIHLIDKPKQNDRWSEQVRYLMEPFGDWAVYGFDSDATSFYLKLFPERELITHPGPGPSLHATEIRKLYFRPDPDMEAISKMVPHGTYQFLLNYQITERWKLAAQQGAYT
jgi:bifunctional NMN adenylyltransferase/nudix hydrolase